MECNEVGTVRQASAREISRITRNLIAAQVVFLAFVGLAYANPDEPKKVNCDKGQTIAQKLQDNAKPITIEVRGTCHENVVIDRDDVTLVAGPSGGTVNGPDPTQNTITVRGARIVIDGLTVTGGFNGITNRGGLTIRNCTVQGTGRNGISFYRGGHGTVDHCTVRNNPRFGIRVEGGSATVTNSTISGNTEAGIIVNGGGNGRIGITDVTTYAGNTITGNQQSGIWVGIGGTAIVGGNEISSNGIGSGTFGQFGIGVFGATAAIVGNNTISGNAGAGVFAHSSSVLIGDAGFGLPTENTITGNGIGTSATKGGIYGFLGASLDIRNATINGNTGDGVTLNLRSTARMFGDTVTNNSANGILLTRGGGLVLQSPTVSVSGNTLFGVQCTDGESSGGGELSGIIGNTAGEVSPGCTGF